MDGFGQGMGKKTVTGAIRLQSFFDELEFDWFDGCFFVGGVLHSLMHSKCVYFIERWLKFKGNFSSDTYIFWSGPQVNWKSPKQRQVTTFSIDGALFCGAHLDACKFSHSDIFKNQQQFWSQRFWWFFCVVESNGILKITGIDVSSQGYQEPWLVEIPEGLVLFFIVLLVGVVVFFSMFPFCCNQERKTLYYLCPLLRLQCMSCQHIVPKILKNARIFTKVFLWYPNIFPIFWGDFLIHKVILFLVAYQKTTRKRRITG